jgi:hypothetical protein
MSRRMPARVALVAMLALSSLVATSLVPRLAHAAETQVPVLQEVQQLYNSAKFTDAVARLRDALSTGQVSGPEALEAKAWLGRCLVKAGNRVEAKEAFKSLLRQDDGYRLDAVSVPPDEMAVFDQALKEITAEQIEAGRRIPASLEFFGGYGLWSNQDYTDLVELGGGDEFDGHGEFGGAVRFPIRPRWSMEISVMRLRATARDSFPSPGGIDYKLSALPLVVTGYYNVRPGDKLRVNAFVGAGPMLAAQAQASLLFFGILPISLNAGKTGLYAHAGLEGEYLFRPRLSITGRVAGRIARASELEYSGEVLNLYSTTPASKSDINGRDLDFSGMTFQIGLRGYIGY